MEDCNLIISFLNSILVSLTNVDLILIEKFFMNKLSKLTIDGTKGKVELKINHESFWQIHIYRLRMETFTYANALNFEAH